MSVTLDELHNATEGALFYDSSNDRWVKRASGLWDCNVGGRYVNWSSNDLFYSYGRDEESELTERGAPVEDTYSLEQVRSVIEDLIGPATADLVAHRLKRQAPREQVMTVTFKVPVRGLDPMGDTWTDGTREMLNYGIDLSSFEDHDLVTVTVDVAYRLVR